MVTFKVRCFTGGVWDQEDDRDIEAATEKEAAEKACRRELTEAGNIARLSALVWLPETPLTKHPFFVPGPPNRIPVIPKN